MNEFTLYFVEKNDKTIIWDFNGAKIEHCNYKKILKQVCEQEITTLKARQEIVAKITNRHNNIPLYVNEKLIFFKIKDDDNIWINFFNVLWYESENNKTRVFFKNGSTILINKKIKYLKEMAKLIKKITFYTQK
ncbi:MAG: competence protein ComK [Bacilli bacterium]|nr:competence protein ComK [Bacilli bacterium]